MSRLIAVWMILFVFTLVPALFPALSRATVVGVPAGLVWTSIGLIGFATLAILHSRRREGQ